MTSLGRRLASTVATHAKRPALCLAGRSISYQTLDESARLIARKLKGATAAILAGTSLDTYAGVLAVARTGRTYVPLNAELADERLLKHISLAGVTTLIVDRQRRDHACRLLGRVPIPMQVVVPDIETAADPWPDLSPHRMVPVSRGPAAPPDDIGVQDDPQAPLYIAFTSGTTGEPKGIPIPRGNVEAYLDSIHQLFDFGPEDRFSHFFRLSFDLSVHDMFVAWSVGACLHVPEPAELMDPVAFARRHDLTVWFSVPSLASLAIMARKLRPDVLPTLRRALFCGEALSWEVVDAFHAAAPNAAITNLYGPTETTIAITHHTVPKDRNGPADRRASVPIGRPFPGHEAVVVGPDLRLLPPDEPGELLLGGTQLAPDYLGNPEQTAKSFLNLQMTGHGSERWYRTGDLATWTSKGLVFLGRNDTQVKFRGHRIELGEIEAVLQQVAETPLAIVIAAPASDGNPVQQLVAFILPPHPPSRPAGHPAPTPPQLHGAGPDRHGRRPAHHHPQRQSKDRPEEACHHVRHRADTERAMTDIKTIDLLTTITVATRTIAPDRVPATGNLTGDQNLLDFVDSFGLVQVFMAIEEQIGLELDFTKVDLGSITHVEDLAQFIATEAVPGDGSSDDDGTKDRAA